MLPCITTVDSKGSLSVYLNLVLLMLQAPPETWAGWGLSWVVTTTTRLQNSLSPCPMWVLESSRGTSFDRLILLRLQSLRFSRMEEYGSRWGGDIQGIRSWLCTVQVLSTLHFPCVVVVHDPVLHSYFARRHLFFVLDCLSPQSPNYHPQGSNLSPWSSMNSLINLNLQASSCSMHHTWLKFNLGLFLLGCCDHSSLMEKTTEEGFVSCYMSDGFSFESYNCVENM
jgi:hypothetical protein